MESTLTANFPSIHTIERTASVAAETTACLPLSDCLSGQRVTIERLKGRNEIQARLESVGVYPGQRLKVFRSGNRGAMIVDTGDMRLALDRRLVRSVLVRHRIAD